MDPRGGADGYLFTSADGRQTIQARFDGFTFNRLRPYDQWESFRKEAKVHWERFLEIAEPEVVSRIALRYINRIDIPLPIRDFKDYVLTVPEIAPGLPQGLSGFFMRLSIPREKSSSIAIVTETIEPAQENFLPLIFDIDVYRESAFGAHDPDLWNVLEELRDFKNEIFFESITEQAKELFK